MRKAIFSYCSIDMKKGIKLYVCKCGYKNKSANVDRFFTYKCDFEGVKIGCKVIVPFGKKRPGERRLYSGYFCKKWKLIKTI